MDSRAHLLNNHSVEHYQESVATGAERVARSVAAARKPFSGTTPDALAPLVDAVDLDVPLGSVADALDELEGLYLRDAVYFHHPRYLAHLNPPVVVPAVVGETVLSALNSSLDTWDQSAGATLIERRLVDWAARRTGFGAAADGVFTSGGTQSNLQAMLLAREEAWHQAAAAGPRPDRADVLPRLRILASEYSHFSIVKSATLLGLAEDSVISVPCDSDRRMRADALAERIAGCRAAGLLPMAVAATAGTTDFGSIDPLPEIAGLCVREGIWLHVDAAYGCGLLVSRQHRSRLAGVERADSVTVDFHKSFFQPVSSSALVVRDGRTLRHVMYHADYLNPRRSVRERIPNQVDKSIQTTRRFDALKLWMTLRVMGVDAIGELFDEVVARAADAWRLMDADPRFEVVTEPRLSTLVFRYVPGTDAGVAPEIIDEANLYARKTLAADGDAVVAATVVDGRHHLKFTLLNPETSLDDIAAVLDLVAGHAQRYVDRAANGG